MASTNDSDLSSPSSVVARSRLPNGAASRPLVPESGTRDDGDDSAVMRARTAFAVVTRLTHAALLLDGAATMIRDLPDWQTDTTPDQTAATVSVVARCLEYLRGEITTGFAGEIADVYGTTET